MNMEMIKLDTNSLKTHILNELAPIQHIADLASYYFSSKTWGDESVYLFCDNRSLPFRL